MRYMMLSAIFSAIVGSFGTAFIHQKTGRDVQMGGIIGLLVGAIGHLPLLILLWLWLYYGYGLGGGVHARQYGTPRRVWYRWWQ